MYLATFIRWSPAFGPNAGQGAVDQHRFGVRVSAVPVFWRARKHRRFARADEGAVFENVSMVRGGVPDPHEDAARLQHTMIEERGPATKDRVARALDETVRDVSRAV